MQILHRSAETPRACKSYSPSSKLAISCGIFFHIAKPPYMLFVLFITYWENMSLPWKVCFLTNRIMFNNLKKWVYSIVAPEVRRMEGKSPLQWVLVKHNTGSLKTVLMNTPQLSYYCHYHFLYLNIPHSCITVLIYLITVWLCFFLLLLFQSR